MRSKTVTGERPVVSTNSARFVAYGANPPWRSARAFALHNKQSCTCFAQSLLMCTHQQGSPYTRPQGGVQCDGQYARHGGARRPVVSTSECRRCSTVQDFGVAEIRPGSAEGLSHHLFVITGGFSFFDGVAVLFAHSTIVQLLARFVVFAILATSKKKEKPPDGGNSMVETTGLEPVTSTL